MNTYDKGISLGGASETLAVRGLLTPRLRIPGRDDSSAASALVLGLIVLCFVGLDYATGPAIQEPYFYVVFVILSSWIVGPRAGYLLAVGLPLFRLALSLLWALPLAYAGTLISSLIQILTLMVVAYLVGLLRGLVAEVKTLKGSLPICIHCRKIRNYHGQWEEIESYILRQSEVRFSKGICTECANRLEPVRDDNRNGRKRL
jgi:hypothetical protein